jgi:CTP:molybdopterin cytidylyltransferase MocA
VQLTLAAAAGALAEADAGAEGLAIPPGAADAVAAPLTAGLALALAAAADCLMVVADGPPVNASTIPRTRPSAIGMASGTAIRAVRLCGRRRHAGLCPVRIQSTSMMF